MTTHHIANAALALLVPVLGALAPAARAQDLTHKAPPQSQPVVITGATIHTVSGDTLDNASILFDQGVITHLGTNINTPANALTIDATGQHIYPGLIASVTQLGLTEIGAVRATRDLNEVGQFTPEVRAAIAINPDSTLIPVTRSGGVLIAGVLPTGGRVAGRAAIIRLDGWTWQDMAIADDAALVVSYPQVRPRTDWWQTNPIKKQQKRIDTNLDELEAFFEQARAALAKADTLDADDAMIARDNRYEAMRPYLRADNPKPVLVHAQDIDQITAAVEFADRFSLRLIIVGGRDAPLVADLLIDRNIPVIITGVQGFPKRPDAPYDEPYTLARRLDDLGVTWCIANSDDASNTRNLANDAARAVAYGLDRDAAIRSITLAPARILGIDDRYGSLQVGKSATLIITDGDPLEPATRVLDAYIDGRRIDLSNKQTKLRDKYRAKYQQLNDQ